jgi:hypothetical protein
MTFRKDLVEDEILPFPLVGGIIRSLQVFGILASSYFSGVFGKVLSLELSPAVVGGFYLGGH